MEIYEIDVPDALRQGGIKCSKHGQLICSIRACRGHRYVGFMGLIREVPLVTGKLDTGNLWAGSDAAAARNYEACFLCSAFLLRVIRVIFEIYSCWILKLSTLCTFYRRMFSEWTNDLSYECIKHIFIRKTRVKRVEPICLTCSAADKLDSEDSCDWYVERMGVARYQKFMVRCVKYLLSQISAGRATSFSALHGGQVKYQKLVGRFSRWRI